MSKRDNRIFLFDAYIAILKIEKVASNYSNATTLKHDFMAWDSIIREFEIIGEATKHLIEAQLVSSGYRAIVDFRNVLIHAYFGIDEDEVWEIIDNHLLDFKEIVEKAIHSLSNDIKKHYINDFAEENKHLDFIVTTLKNLIG